jgi:hypothetical protein
VHRVLLGSSRFPMLSVDAACAFAFSPFFKILTVHHNFNVTLFNWLSTCFILL